MLPARTPGANLARGLAERASSPGCRWSFRGKDAGSANPRRIGVTEDAASGRCSAPLAAHRLFRQALLAPPAPQVREAARVHDSLLRGRRAPSRHQRVLDARETGGGVAVGREDEVDAGS